MKLEIRNLAKIIEADIEIDGITVIAGDNNTGKSTVGKTLDAVFNSTVNIEEKMRQAKINLLSERIYSIIRQSEYSTKLLSRHTIQRLAKEIIEYKSDNPREIFRDFCRHCLEDSSEQVVDELVNELLEQVAQIQNISQEQLSQNIYTNYFNEVFNENVNSIFSDYSAEIVLEVKGEQIYLEFLKNKCVRTRRNIKLVNSSLYIDDPFILDELNQQDGIGGFRLSNMNISRRNICKKLSSSSKEDIEEQALKQLIVNNRLENIIELINEVAPGEVIKQQHYMYRAADNYNAPLNLNSLSTGLKSFVILKQLLLNDQLKEKDVIVLDEPEIHLHPEWQMKYAEIIVCLQKEFDFSIIVTTHSSHFMEALELYSKKYGISDKSHYYLARNYENGTRFEDVTENTGIIYKEMVEPSLSLDILREELYLDND